MQKSYEKILAWQKAHAFCKSVYHAAETLPFMERYRITGQLCRAAASVPSNLVEGSSRMTPADKRHFYTIALASLDEAHYFLRLAFELNFLPENIYKECSSLAEETSIFIVLLRRALPQKNQVPSHL